MIKKLNKNNFIVFAMKCYNNSGSNSIGEFKEDLIRLKYIKRLLNRYIKSGIFKEKLLLNHIIILCNVFGNEGAVKMMFFKLDKKLYSALKTIFIYLNIMPEKIVDIENIIIYNNEIPIDMNIANILRTI